jgi:hypothetical protein
MAFNFYSDPGHGWLKVPKKLLKKLNIEKDISLYSYMRKDFAYLEEDRDCNIFIDKLKETKIPFKIKTFNTNKNSKIRGYNYYKTN